MSQFLTKHYFILSIYCNLRGIIDTFAHCDRLSLADIRVADSSFVSARYDHETRYLRPHEYPWGPESKSCGWRALMIGNHV